MTPGLKVPAALTWVFGALLLLAGLYVLIAGLPNFSGRGGYRFEQLGELPPGAADFPDAKGRYPVQKVARYRLEHGEARLELNVVEYRDDSGRSARAMVYHPATANALGADQSVLRHELWQKAMTTLAEHAADDALFLSWWDNAQRIRFASGRQTWVEKPVAGAYPNTEERSFWQTVAGGLEKDETRSRQLARWLGMEAETALAEMTDALPKDKPLYFLLCVDDLARLGEIETLAGRRLPFEARIFPPSSNFHGQIAAVKQWANETGVGAYLVQALANGSVRAWRITTEDGAKTLLARLLPFTTSLAHPLPMLTPVYQSAWGSYLTIYQWRR